MRAFADGQAQIDPWHWETNDKAWVDGHFYSVKSPGMAALDHAASTWRSRRSAGEKLARAAVDNERQTAHPKWHPDSVVPLENYGYDVERGLRVQARVEEETPIVWALTLIAAVIPGVLLLLGVRWAADRFVPGYGTAAAITLGLATIVMTFSAEFFSHVISAALAFAAFCVLMKERDGPMRRSMVFAAGLLAGLAVTFEFQTGLVGVVLIFYALARPQTGRAGATSHRCAAPPPTPAARSLGAAPMLAFNTWAFGNPLKLAYGDAVAFPGSSGHDVLGLNSDGFFGITAPRFDSATDLLFAGRGLIVLTPIVVMAVVGVFLMRRRHRAEANTILAVAAVYFIYNSGYWLPFGGGTPGPRFLIPALPFLADRARLRLPAPARPHPGPGHPLGALHAGRHPHLSADRQAGDRHLGRLARPGPPRAHRPHRLRRDQRLARARALLRRGGDRDRPRRPGDTGHAVRRLPAGRARGDRLGLRLGDRALARPVRDQLPEPRQHRPPSG